VPLNKNGIGSDQTQAQKMRSGDETTIPDSRVLLLCGMTLQVITMGTLRHIQLE